VEVIATRNEQMNMQALMSDSVQFLTSSSTGLFYLGKQGLDAVGIASWNNASPYSIGSRLKIKDLKQLKGRKIASSGAGGRADAFIRFMLAKVGIDTKTDVQILPLSGGSAVRLAAVVSGNLDATLISSLQGRHAEKLGLTVIPVPLEYVWGVNITRRSYISKNREIVKNYLRGLSDSVRLMMADKAATTAIMAQVLKIDDRDSLDYSYKIMEDDARHDLFPTEEAIVKETLNKSSELWLDGEVKARWRNDGTDELRR
jgi:ABC-type nitrate/sulfonate/bicarbonate transport system substrate-binding protein